MPEYDGESCDIFLSSFHSEVGADAPQPAGLLSCRSACLSLFAILLVVPAADALATLNIDSVTVGNVGNANDSTGYGGVAYAYSIGKTEVTVGQYTAFLNAVAATDTYALYNPLMATDLKIAGIARSGVSGSYSYGVIGSADKPVTYVSWGDAARFSNWLHNNQPTGLQNATTTERGAYTLDGAVTNAALNAVTRNPGAQWVIPTENEWYKAAYHQPAAQGGDSDNYWAYPTRTNSEPNSDQPPGDPSIQADVANFYRDDGIANGYNDGYAVTGSTSFPSGNALTDVGAYTFATSPYGTLDQGGNVYEWHEALINLSGSSYRGLRGGSWTGLSNLMPASSWNGVSPVSEGFNFGFRVATIPEPGAAALLMLVCGVTWWCRKWLK